MRYKIIYSIELMSWQICFNILIINFKYFYQIFEGTTYSTGVSLTDKDNDLNEIPQPAKQGESQMFISTNKPCYFDVETTGLC